MRWRGDWKGLLKGSVAVLNEKSWPPGGQLFFLTEDVHSGTRFLLLSYYGCGVSNSGNGVNGNNGVNCYGNFLNNYGRILSSLGGLFRVTAGEQRCAGNNSKYEN